MDNNKPLSPHIQIYSWNISSLISISHRITVIINIVASHSVRKDHYITTNENYFNEIIFPISDKDLSSDEFNRDLETDLYVKARVNNQTHFSRHYVGLNFNTNSEI